RDAPPPDDREGPVAVARRDERVVVGVERVELPPALLFGHGPDHAERRLPLRTEVVVPLPGQALGGHLAVALPGVALERLGARVVAVAGEAPQAVLTIGGAPA